MQNVPVSDLKMDLHVDWLAFTYRSRKADDNPRYNHFDDFVEEFPELKDYWQDSVLLNHTRSWYNHVLSFSDNVRISFDNENNANRLGVNVDIPAHGLEYFISMFGVSSFADFLKILFERNCRISRIDLAFDDYSKTFDPDYFIDKWIHKLFVTQFRRVTFTCTNHKEGSTFYLGTRGSDKMLRIYDKAFQSQGEIDSIRYEFELHKKYADEMCHFVLENSIDFAAYISSYFRIVSNKNSKINVDINRAALPDDPDWMEFLAKGKFSEQLETIKVPHFKNSVTFESMHKWIKTISGCLSVYRTLVGDAVFSDILNNVTIARKYYGLFPQLRYMTPEKNYYNISDMGPPIVGSNIQDILENCNHIFGG